MLRNVLPRFRKKRICGATLLSTELIWFWVYILCGHNLRTKCLYTTLLRKFVHEMFLHLDSFSGFLLLVGEAEGEGEGEGEGGGEGVGEGEGEEGEGV